MPDINGALPGNANQALITHFAQNGKLVDWKTGKLLNLEAGKLVERGVDSYVAQFQLFSAKKRRKLRRFFACLFFFPNSDG